MEYLVQEGFTRARNEKRKTIFYKDLGMYKTIKLWQQSTDQGGSICCERSGAV